MDGIQNFDPKLLTTLKSDWLTTGMGFWLRQKYYQCKNLSLDCCRLESVNGWISFLQRHQILICGNRRQIGSNSLV